MQLPIWMRLRGFCAWGIQTGSLAALEANFVLKFFQLLTFILGSPFPLFPRAPFPYYPREITIFNALPLTGESGPNHSIECRIFSRLPHDDPSFDIRAPEVDCPAYAAVLPIRMLGLRNTGTELSKKVCLGCVIPPSSTMTRSRNLGHIFLANCRNTNLTHFCGRNVA